MFDHRQIQLYVIFNEFNELMRRNSSNRSNYTGIHSLFDTFVSKRFVLCFFGGKSNGSPEYRSAHKFTGILPVNDFIHTAMKRKSVTERFHEAVLHVKKGAQLVKRCEILKTSVSQRCAKGD